MTDGDKQSYTKIVDELSLMMKRLDELASAGFADMEGADAPEFFIAEEFYNLEAVAMDLKPRIQRLRELIG